MLPNECASAASERVGQNDNDAGREPNESEHADHSPGVLLKQCRFRFDLLQCLADFSKLGTGARAQNLNDPLTGSYQRAREKRIEILATWTLKITPGIRCRLANRCRLSSKERLVHRKIDPSPQYGIGRDTVALGE